MSKVMRLAGWFLIIALLPTVLAAQTRQESEIVEVSISASGDETNLDLELSDGRSLLLRLADGHVFFDAKEVGVYEPGGEFEVSWRDMLRQAVDGDFAGAWSAFVAGQYSESDAVASAALADALEAALADHAVRVSRTPNVTPEATERALDAGEIAEMVQEATAIAVQEMVDGGLVVQLSEMEGLARSLGRIGLTSRLSRELNGALVPPMRIVLEADEYLLPEGALVDESLWLVETDAMLAGTVEGNVFVAEGSLIIAPSALIEGDLITLDATIENLGGTIVGEIRSLNETIAPVVVAPAPIRIQGFSRGAPSFLSNVGRGLGTIIQSVAAYIMLALVGALVVYFFRGQLETVADTVSFSFGRSFLTGLAAQILFMPVLLVMVVLVLTWIAIPVYVVGFLAASILGYLAVAHAAGENLTRRRYASWEARVRRSNSYYYVLNGLAVLLGFFAAAGVAEMGGALLAWAYGLLIASALILTWVASTAGVGAALLSRGGTQRTYARPHQLPELPMELPKDSLEEEMETIQRRARGSERRKRAQGESDEG